MHGACRHSKQRQPGGLPARHTSISTHLAIGSCSIHHTYISTGMYIHPQSHTPPPPIPPAPHTHTQKIVISLRQYSLNCKEENKHFPNWDIFRPHNYQSQLSHNVISFVYLQLPSVFKSCPLGPRE